MCYFLNNTATTEIYTLSLHDALPICRPQRVAGGLHRGRHEGVRRGDARGGRLLGVAGQRAGQVLGEPAGEQRPEDRSEEHTSELQSRQYLVRRLLLEKNIRERDYGYE